MPRTWSVEKPKQRQFAIAALMIQFLILLAGLVLVVRSDALSPIFVLIVALTLTPTAMALQQTRMSTTAHDVGLAVYDGFRTREIPWADIDGIGKHEVHDLVAMRHTDGKDVSLPGVRGQDVPELRTLLRERR